MTDHNAHFEAAFDRWVDTRYDDDMRPEYDDPQYNETTRTYTVVNTPGTTSCPECGAILAVRTNEHLYAHFEEHGGGFTAMGGRFHESDCERDNPCADCRKAIAVVTR